jgi:hypothetical protein
MQITGMLSLKRTAQEDLGRTLLNRANGVEQCFIVLSLEPTGGP